MTAADPTVLLRDDPPGAWLRYRRPHAVVAARTVAEVAPALAEAAAAVERRGWHAAGWIAYEAAPAFDPALRAHPPGALPLLWLGLFPEPERTGPEALVGEGEDFEIGAWAPTATRAEYDAAIASIKGAIARGETYQVNHTFRLRAPFSGSPAALFAALARAQETPYAAFVDTGEHAVASVSPELFFDLDGAEIRCRPMKGTARRGRTTAEDRERAAGLAASEKDRAENVMIVDMIRNDLGRIAVPGSVAVPRIFTAERYPTLWQLTSTVEALTDAPLPEVMAALFPCASITGAPKVSTSRIIAALEGTPRGVYTGAIGRIAPGRRARFSVAIRTVTVDRAAGTAEYGTGGGVVWDSTSGGEYEEALLKARVLDARRPAFALLETMLWTPGEGWALRERHLARLLDSADYFGYPADRAAIEARLDALAAGFPAAPQRVRLLLHPDGSVGTEAAPLATLPAPLRVRLAATPVDPADPMLFHKTTARAVYERARAERPGCDDVLLWNVRGEATESTIANLVVELDGQLVTPALDCGLLPGTFRAQLLAEGRVREGIVPAARLREGARFWLVNSVRGWMEAVVLSEEPGAGHAGRG